jgi:hypothetical protein
VGEVQVKGKVNSFGLDAVVRVRGNGSNRISHVKVYMTACIMLGKMVVSYTSIGSFIKLFVFAL